MKIFHIATDRDWRAARTAGSYTTSTRGRTLADEGFIHAAHREQVPNVFAAFYLGVREPLVLLSIDTDLLDVPWREDLVGEESYPHIYGPLPASAVVTVEPLNSRGGTASFTMLFLQEMLRRILPAIAVMFVGVLGSAIGRAIDPEAGPLAGAVLGLLVGIGVLILVARLRRR